MIRVAISITTTGPASQGLLKQYDASLADYAEAQKVNPDGPQVPAYRCITYASMGKFDEALIDCNAALAKRRTRSTR